MTDQATEPTTEIQGLSALLTPEQRVDESYKGLVEKTPDVPTLAKNYVELQRAFGKKTEGMVKIPGADAPETDRLAFHQALGVPDKPDAYELPDFADLKDSLPGGENWKPHAGMDKWFREQAHALGLTPAQFQTLYKSQIQFQLAEMKAIDQQLEEHTKKAFGDKYDEAVKVANRAVAKMPEELQKSISGQVGKSPLITQLLHWMGGRMGESQSPENPSAPAGGEGEFGSLIQQYKTVMASKEYQSGKQSETTKALELMTQIQLAGKGLGLNTDQIRKRING